MSAPKLRPLVLLVSILSTALLATSAMAAERKVVAPADGTPEKVVHQALLAALSEDFGKYLELMHPDYKSTPKAIRELEKYSWARFVRQVEDYTSTAAKGAFVVVRQDPAKLGKDDERVRFFLEAVNNKKRTYPTPIRLQKHEGKWLITANSL